MGPLDLDGWREGASAGIWCECSACHGRFVLTGRGEKEAIRRGLPSAEVSVRSCDSGGVYGAHVDCPHCGHEHDVF